MNMNNMEVIGIDHGWSMMKTVSQVFITGAREIKTEPAVYDDVLELDGKYFKIGTQRQEVKDTKTEDESFLILTYAAIAKELRKRGKTEADIFLAVGLPLTRFGNEKADFVKYLTERKEVSFCYEGILYNIRIANTAVFPQCYAAVADRIVGFKKKTVIVDIATSREKQQWEDTLTNRMLHWNYTEGQQEELHKAIAAKISKEVIMKYFYPDVSVKIMQEKFGMNNRLKKWYNNGIIEP